LAFRTLVFNSRCKLEYSLNYLVYRGDCDKRILLDEIEMVIIQNPCVSLTTALLIELTKKKIKVLFCDEKSNPSFEIVPYENNCYVYKKIKEQIQRKQKFKDAVWDEIVKRKIDFERLLLLKLGIVDYANLLMQYENEVINGDARCREGHAAKVYFNSLFGSKFSRDLVCDTNKYLNYGYSILVSAINREIKMAGYLLEFGIHHVGETNPFNFAYDLVEPLRTLVDSMVVLGKVDENSFKSDLVSMLSLTVKFNDQHMYLDNALHLYILSVFRALQDENLDALKFIEYEF
jgi:CRISPR-associated endonuclease Cas1 subtype II